MSVVNYLVGSGVVTNRPLLPFDEEAVSFLNALSRELMQIPGVNRFSDLVYLAFYCRKGNLVKQKEAYDTKNRIGRGLVFHITPSNVPVNFAFSYVFSLLAGNSNIVRVPSKPYQQTQMICETIRRVIDGFPEIACRTAIIDYTADQQTTAGFCLQADARMIWGGNETVADIRGMRTMPRCVDVVFADRYSICVLDGNAVSAASDAEIKRLAEGFYNDTYVMDQNACSSPHLILWQNPSATVKDRFWSEVAALADRKYDLQPAIAVDKYTLLCENAIDLTHIGRVRRYGNRLYLAELSTLLGEEGNKLRGIGGYFYEYNLNGLDDIEPIINEKYQTITYFGANPQQIKEWVTHSKLRGIDRIVPIGSAMDIGLTWDGYNLIDTLTRIVQSV